MFRLVIGDVNAAAAADRNAAVSDSPTTIKSDPYVKTRRARWWNNALSGLQWPLLIETQGCTLGCRMTPVPG